MPLALLVDTFAAGTVVLAAAVVLPILSLACVVALRSARSAAGGVSARRPPRRDDEESLPGAYALLALKGLALLVLLLQLNDVLGPLPSAWVATSALEEMRRWRDPSVVALLEPAWGSLDAAFLLLIAPALCVPAGLLHGLSAYWLSWLSCAFFWRSDASATAALSLGAAAYALSWLVGAFEWSRWASEWRAGAPCELDVTPSDAATLGACLGLVPLVQRSIGRTPTLVAALAFSARARALVDVAVRESVRLGHPLLGSLLERALAAASAGAAALGARLASLVSEGWLRALPWVEAGVLALREGVGRAVAAGLAGGGAIGAWLVEAARSTVEASVQAVRARSQGQGGVDEL